MTRLRLFALAAAFLAVSGCQRPYRPASARPRPGATAVYELRGLLDTSTSGGLDVLATKIEASGRWVRVDPFEKWEAVAALIAADRPARLVLIGHSYGGGGVIRIATRLGEVGIVVDLIILLDASDPWAEALVPPPIPNNVRTAIHVCINSTTPGLRPCPRVTVAAGNDFTNLVTVMVGVNHLAIDDDVGIHTQVIRWIEQAGL